MATEKAAVQRLVVHIACLAKGTQQDAQAGAAALSTLQHSKRQRLLVDD